MSISIDTEEGRRARLEGELLKIREEFARRPNHDGGFAYVRDSFPEAAKILYCGRDLRFTDLKNADLRNIDFRGANLTGCDFSNALIDGARFELAKVSRDALAKAGDWRVHLQNWLPADPAAPVRFRREPGERFGFSPLLPELVILPSDLLVEAAEGGAAPQLSDEERQFLSTGRLAIAVGCVTKAEWASVIAPENAVVDRDPILLRSYAANAYCGEVTKKAQQFGLPRGTRIALPGFNLFHRIAVAGTEDGRLPERPDRTDLSLADLGVGAGLNCEFVERWLDTEPSASTGARFLTHFHRELGSVTLMPPPADRALLRPVFFLGEAE
ncbi:MAG: hypothetical protein JWL86_2825 [Rhizobium sp.]|nr:hypothetical protein [Rhizobium sp.]